MKDSVFVDTGFWIALFDKRDNNHPAAKTGLGFLIKNYRLCLSEFILFETITYLNCSVKRHDLAMRFLQKSQEPILEMLIVNATAKNDALNLFKKYSDKNLSVTDCTSFILMNQYGIQKYAGFDDHFQQMKFVCAIEA